MVISLLFPIINGCSQWICKISGFQCLLIDLRIAKKPDELSKKTETPTFESELERAF